MTFLNAHWKNLILINYEIDPNLLKPLVPKGTELDLFNGKCYVSVVGFMFMETKVLGIKLPHHINFEEVNFRFYVKYNGKRGVVFIKEIVSKPLITFVANGLYHEHYQTLKTKHNWSEKEDHNHYKYQWKVNNLWQTISVKTGKEFSEIQQDSEEQFITEHYFGYTKHKNKTFEYEVVHPSWRQQKVIDHEFKIDFEANYGQNFACLNLASPTSVIFAEGSEISVKNKKVIHK